MPDDKSKDTAKDSAAKDEPAEETTPGPQQYEQQARDVSDETTVPVDAGGNPTR